MTPPNFTLTQLLYLIALDKYRHFGRAADACHVTQPTLSMQVQKLEEDLGVLCFDRSSRPISPTRIGEQIIAQARVVLAEAERLSAMVQEMTGEMKGELRIGIISTLAPYLLPLVIEPFARRYAGVELIFEELLADRIIDFVKRDLLDAGLIATPVSDSGIVDLPLFREPLVAYIAPDHELFDRPRLRIEDVNINQVWLMREGHSFRNLIVDALEPGSRDEVAGRAVQFESDNLETLQRLVDNGYGMTLLPWLAVQGQGSFAAEQVREFEDPPTRTVRLVYAKVLARRRLAEAFSDEVLQAVSRVLPEEFLLGDRNASESG